MYEYLIVFTNTPNHEFQLLDIFQDPIALTAQADASFTTRDSNGGCTKITLAQTTARFTIEHGGNFWNHVEYHLQLPQRAVFFRVRFYGRYTDMPCVSITRDGDHELLKTEPHLFKQNPAQTLPLSKEITEEIEHKITALERQQSAKSPSEKTSQK